jgi:diaminopimelate decarboxylase
MDHFIYRQGLLHAEQIPVGQLAAEYGTPLYVYSRAALEKQYRAYQRAFGDHPHQVCYAVKANSNIAVLNVLARLGAGFDIVSVGELERVIRAGGKPACTVFSGVGKRPDEIHRALALGIGCFNIESVDELDRIAQVATASKRVAPISIRVNPDVDANTHPYISTGLKQNKFGIDMETAEKVYLQAATLPVIDIVGINCHIGSQLTSTAPFLDALERLLSLLDSLEKSGIEIQHLDLGGGLGVCYRHERPPSPEAYIGDILQQLGGRLRHLKILVEPGRSIAANAGILLTRVEFLKHGAVRNFAIVDAAMNDLLRPALYSAWQDIVPTRQDSTAPTHCYDIVGPICETGDFLGKDRDLKLEPGDLLAVCSAGAYGFTMSSNYNSRNRAAEVMVDGEQAHLIRRRETIADQLAAEALLP